MRFVQSPYHSSRNNYNIDLVVIHTTVGYYEGTINYFKSNTRKVSAHYVVKEDGAEVTQMVDEARAAHHAGITYNPTEKYIKRYSNGDIVNPNFYTIGIENADKNDPHGHDRTGQYKTLAILVRDICKRWNLPIDRDHVCGHRELYGKKTCPGNIDVDKVVQLAREANFEMDDDTKRALEQLQVAKAEFGYGNLESAVRGLMGAQRDIVAVKNELESYKAGESIRIEKAVNKALEVNNATWQSQLDSANKKIGTLTTEVETLKAGLAENLSYAELFSIAFKKLWIFRKSSNI